MSKTYREQIVELLGDGEWHSTAELAHPFFPPTILGAFVRLLRASGYNIEETEDAGNRLYRLNRGTSSGEP